MKACNQTKDWSVTLFGETLPKYEFYGKIGRTVYRLDYFTSRLLIRDEKRNVWKSALYTPNTGTTAKAVYDAVTAYVKTHGVQGTKIEVCKYSQEAKKREFHARKRDEQEARRDLESVLPHMRSGRISASGAAPHQYDSSRKCVRVETDRIWGDPVQSVNSHGRIETVYIDPKAPNPISADERDRGYLQRFEMGQTTSGTAGKYTRSGFETKDGLKIQQNKIRPEKRTVKREKLIIRVNGKTVYSEHND